MKRAVFNIFASVFGLCCATRAMATVPDLLPVQGVLTDPDGIAINGAVDMRFAIYDAATDGNELWFEARTGASQVNVDNGFFTVYLGEVTALDSLVLIAADELWLELQVDAETMGRSRLAAEPFAFECKQIGDLAETDIVTAVSASAPLSSSGGSSPNISIAQASASADGYLSSADWNVFNGKQDPINDGSINISANQATANTVQAHSYKGFTGGVSIVNGATAVIFDTSVSGTGWGTYFVTAANTANSAVFVYGFVHANAANPSNFFQKTTLATNGMVLDASGHEITITNNSADALVIFNVVPFLY
ncbi:MAG: hypothetical protein PHU25_00790 [Deltaproteobacteria bacterium]|nr:hypothetical protein [Deltaproteobacteria bacterium]